MTIKVTEVGKLFNYSTFYDLSANTGLDLKFTSPSGVVSVLSNPRVTAPAVPVVGSIPANTYMQITTQATDFTEAGLWTVCGTYTDATPKVFYGDDATFEVGEAC